MSLMQDAPPVDHDTPPAAPARVRRRLQSAQDLRGRRRRRLGSVIFAASFVLMVNALFGERGYFATVSADREHAVLTEALERTRADNQELRTRAQRLRNDPATLEEAARDRLGMIKPGEVLVILK
jgi:cell division protein FtsB